MTRPLLAPRTAVLAAAGILGLAAASGPAYAAWGKVEGGGPQTTRTLAWPGGDTLGVSVSANIRYVQGANRGLVVSGRRTTVDNVVVENGVVKFARPMWNSGPIDIVLTAPDVKRFRLSGSNRLRVDGYNQDSLELSVSGSGDADLNGRTRRADLKISGSGKVDAARLVVADAGVRISGSGEVTVGPTESADIRVSGSGDVELTSRPARLQSKISGSGSVNTR